MPERIYFLLHVLFRLSTLPCISRSQPPVAPGEAAEGRDGAGEPSAAGPGAPILAQKKGFVSSMEEKKFPSFPAVGVCVGFRWLAINWKRNLAERLGPAASVRLAGVLGVGISCSTAPSLSGFGSLSPG